MTRRPVGAYTLDYSEDHKYFADSIGLPFSQAHAPFSFSLKKGEDFFLSTVKERVSRAIEIAGILEVPLMVVHPMQFRPYYKKKNQKFPKEKMIYIYVI